MKPHFSLLEKAASTRYINRSATEKAVSCKVNGKMRNAEKVMWGVMDHA